MRLGKDVGSVTNWMMAHNNNLPIVGKGMTQLMWSDRYAYEVMEVSQDGKKVVVRAYNTTCEYYSGYPKDGNMGTLYEQDIHMKFSHGKWRMKERYDDKYNVVNVIFGVLDPYRDPHF
jgi:hypothetical protein